jgi:hypothetical protein
MLSDDPLQRCRSGYLLWVITTELPTCEEDNTTSDTVCGSAAPWSRSADGPLLMSPGNSTLEMWTKAESTPP